jgi:death on curing protein
MAEGDGGQVDWLDELVDLLREVHDLALKQSGGMQGEHTASLYAAAARPFQSAFGELAYSTAFEQAAALFHAIICDHVFVDGNKRTGTLAALFLLRAHRVLTSKEPPSHLQVRLLGEVAIETASGKLTVEQVVYWLHRIFDP